MAARGLARSRWQRPRLVPWPQSFSGAVVSGLVFGVGVPGRRQRACRWGVSWTCSLLWLCLGPLPKIKDLTCALEGRKRRLRARYWPRSAHEASCEGRLVRTLRILWKASGAGMAEVGMAGAGMAGRKLAVTRRAAGTSPGWGQARAACSGARSGRSRPWPVSCHQSRNLLTRRRGKGTPNRGGCPHGFTPTL